jgi:Secretion system C-terminal sorting domain/Bacterial Ig domain
MIKKLLHTHFIRLLLLLLLPVAISAQNSVTRTMVVKKGRNTGQFDVFAFPPDFPAAKSPKHGKLKEPKYDPNSQKYDVSYEQTDPNYVGTDDFLLVSVDMQTMQSTYYHYIVSCVRSELKLNNDLTITGVSTFIDIPVLKNDISDAKPIVISPNAIVANHGTAVMVGDSILRFTPEKDFKGVAFVSYSACDAEGTCGNATVNILVQDALAIDKTLRLATSQGTPLVVALPFVGGSVQKKPSHGTVDMVLGSIEAIFNNEKDFLGRDTFVISTKSAGTCTVIVDVLKKNKANDFAKDDYIYTSAGQKVDFSVTKNDIYDMNYISELRTNTITGGRVACDDRGNCTFIPNPGFEGSTSFNYESCFGSNCETATTYITVSNFFPQGVSAYLTTVKNTPRVINYNIPITNFEIEIVSNPKNGALDQYNGQKTITVEGVKVEGNNLLVYTPKNGFVGKDPFEIRYCVKGTNQCKTLKIEMDVVNANTELQCIDDCVWAGDINYDGVVTMSDLLQLGFGIGEKGIQRPDASLDWYGQYADNWERNGKGSIYDWKHLDTDGDGLVSPSDTAAISLSYGKAHRIVAEFRPPVKKYPLNFKLLNPELRPGDMFEMEVEIGNSTTPMVDIYGYVFSFRFNPAQIDPKSVNIEFTDDSWMSQNAPAIGMVKKPIDGQADAGYVRVSGRAASGGGKVAKVRGTVVDIIDGARKKDKLNLEIAPQILMTENGDKFTIAPISKELILTLETPKATITDAQVLTYPNPTTDVLQIHVNGNDVIRAVELFNAAGQMVQSVRNLSSEHTSIAVNTLPSGIYMTKITTDSGVVTKKVTVK